MTRDCPQGPGRKQIARARGQIGSTISSLFGSDKPVNILLYGASSTSSIGSQLVRDLSRWSTNELDCPVDTVYAAYNDMGQTVSSRKHYGNRVRKQTATDAGNTQVEYIGVSKVPEHIHQIDLAILVADKYDMKNAQGKDGKQIRLEMTQANLQLVPQIAEHFRDYQNHLHVLTNLPEIMCYALANQSTLTSRQLSGSSLVDKLRLDTRLQEEALLVNPDLTYHHSDAFMVGHHSDPWAIFNHLVVYDGRGNDYSDLNFSHLDSSQISQMVKQRALDVLENHRRAGKQGMATKDETAEAVKLFVTAYFNNQETVASIPYQGSFVQLPVQVDNKVLRRDVARMSRLSDADYDELAKRVTDLKQMEHELVPTSSSNKVTVVEPYAKESYRDTRQENTLESVAPISLIARNKRDPRTLVVYDLLSGKVSDEIELAQGEKSSIVGLKYSDGLYALTMDRDSPEKILHKISSHSLRPNVVCAIQADEVKDFAVAEGKIFTAVDHQDYAILTHNFDGSSDKAFHSTKLYSQICAQKNGNGITIAAKHADKNAVDMWSTHNHRKSLNVDIGGRVTSVRLLRADGAPYLLTSQSAENELSLFDARGNPIRKINADSGKIGYNQNGNAAMAHVIDGILYLRTAPEFAALESPTTVTRKAPESIDDRIKAIHTTSDYVVVVGQKQVYVHNKDLQRVATVQASNASKRSDNYALQI